MDRKYHFMAHVFISYARIDGEFAKELRQKLEESGFEVWIDTERLRVGEDWRQAIDDAIRASFALVAVMTPEAAESKYVTYEWACAWGAGISVIPLMLKTAPLHPRLDALQYLNFTYSEARPWTQLLSGLAEILNEFGHNTVHVPRNAPLAVRRAAEDLDSPNPVARKAAIESLAQIQHTSAAETLMGATTHPTRDVRLQATTHLLKLNQARDKRILPAVLEVMDAVDEMDIQARQLAIKWIGTIKDPSSVRRLSLVLNRDVSSELRRASLEAITLIKGEIAALPDLIDALRDADADIRNLGSATIARVGEDAIPALIEVLYSVNDPQARQATSSALAAIGEAAIPSLLEAIINPDPEVYSSAANILAKIGQPALPGLNNLLKYGQSYVRLTVVNVIAKIGSENAIPSLLQALHDTASSVSLAASKGLAAIGEPSISGLMDALRDIPSMAVSTLKQIGWRPSGKDPREAYYYVATGDWENAVKFGSEAIPALLSRSRDPDFNTRVRIIKSLAQIGDPQVISPLTDLLGDENTNVKLIIVQTLGQFHNAAAIPALLERLGDPDRDIRNAATRALVQIGESAVPGLIKMLQAANTATGIAAADALGALAVLMKPEKRTSVLTNLLSILRYQNKDLQWAAGRALRQFGDAAIPGLIDASTDLNPDTRYVAIHALGQIGNTIIIPALINRLADKQAPTHSNQRICDLSATILERLGTPEALAALEQRNQEQGQ
jgi:HEAT repeat protein